jgi:hypothetical protein
MLTALVVLSAATVASFIFLISSLFLSSNTVARWLVPKMVKNGLYSSFVYWSLI